jgi:tetratricopeptide (TPR) repeat protein
MLAAAVCAQPALAADGPTRPKLAPSPDWVLPAAVPPAPDHTDGAAVINLLMDSQVHLIDGGVASYRANVFRIATSPGLDAGALQINWDPSLEVLTIHRYRILRDGKAIDLLGDGSKLQVVRREKNLENATLDGELTASQQPEDLRVGDVIDLAYTIVRRDPATGGRAEGLYGPQDGVAYGRYRLRMTWPKARMVQWRAAPGVVQPKLTVTDGQDELTADIRNVVTQRSPSNAPARYDLVNLVDITEFADWPAVSRRFAALFDQSDRIAPGSPLQAQIARIAAATPDPVHRAELALTLVEDQVRYLFIGIDDGGFVPAPADQTWQRRFGDCKGKTALLIALLRGLGIEARPVLVNTGDGDATAHRLPTMAGFDHVIVEATIAGRVYWLDGTRQGDTRLARLQMPNYGVGLPATAQGSGLIALVPPAPAAPQNLTSLTLDASAGIEVPAGAEAEMRFHGEDAAEMRMKYAGLSTADLDLELKKLWRGTYDFITPDEVSAKGEEPGGDFVIAMHGHARMDWATTGTSRWYELDRARLGWKIDTTRDGELMPDAPFVFTWPEWWANHETVILPHHGLGFTLQSRDIDSTVGDLYALHRKVTLDHGVVTMDNDTRALKAELPAAEAETVRSALQDLAGEGVFIRLPDDYLHTAADFAALSGDKPALTRAHQQDGKVWLDRGDAAAAIAEETAALSLDPRPAAAHGVLALGLAREGKSDARALAEANTVLATTNEGEASRALAWAARGTVYLRQKDYGGALAAYNRVIAADRNDINALLGRGTAYVGLGHPAQALADFDAAQAMMPDVPIAAVRAMALAGVGRREEALDAADRALELAPDDRQTRRLRVAVREETGDMAGALADADTLLAHDPGAEDYLVHADLRPTTDIAGREADIAAALRRDPANASAFLMRAQDAITGGRLDAAATALAAAERLKGDPLSLAALRLDLMAKRGDAAGALKLAGETVAGHPGDPQALNVVCWFKATHNVALDSARADCDAALKLAAGTPAFLDSRGFVRLRANDDKGAIADYSAALRHAPELVSSLYGRGIAWARLGDRNRALADLSRARSDRPEIDAVWADYGVTPPAGF